MAGLINETAGKDAARNGMEGNAEPSSVRHAVVLYDTLLELYDQAGKLAGWTADHDGLMCTALDIVFNTMSDSDMNAIEKKLLDRGQDTLRLQLGVNRLRAAAAEVKQMLATDRTAIERVAAATGARTRVPLDAVIDTDRLYDGERLVVSNKGQELSECSDPYHLRVLEEASQRVLSEAEAADKAMGSVFIMGTYACPDAKHGAHCPSTFVSSGDEPPSALDVALITQQMRLFADDLEKLFGVV